MVCLKSDRQHDGTCQTVGYSAMHSQRGRHSMGHAETRIRQRHARVQSGMGHHFSCMLIVGFFHCTNDRRFRACVNARDDARTMPSRNNISVKWLEYRDISLSINCVIASIPDCEPSPTADN